LGYAGPEDHAQDEWDHGLKSRQQTLHGRMHTPYAGYTTLVGVPTPTVPA